MQFTRANGPGHGPIGRAAGGAGGFTLVEVIMSVFVLALAITTSITVLQRAYNNYDSARNLETASRILQAEIDIWMTVVDILENKVKGGKHAK